MFQFTIQISKHSDVSDSLIRPVAVGLLEETNRIIAIDHSEKYTCKVLDLNSKECIYSFGSYGTGTGQFMYPVSISMMGSVVCVADFHRNVIVMLTSEGYFITEVDLNHISRNCNFLYTLQKPWSLSYSANSSSLYCAFMVTSRIIRLSPLLPFQITFGKGSLVQPLCVCVGKNEMICVLDKTTSIKCFQEDGVLVGTVNLMKICKWSSESLVKFVMDTKGHFIVCPSSLNTIIVFSPTGEQIFPVSCVQMQEFGLDSPLDICLDKKERTLVVSDTFNGRVQLFDYSITLL